MFFLVDNTVIIYKIRKRFVLHAEGNESMLIIAAALSVVIADSMRTGIPIPAAQAFTVL
jgi:hypothetical protein